MSHIIYFEAGLRPVLKHGTHDQKDHGNWAKGSESNDYQMSHRPALGRAEEGDTDGASLDNLADGFYPDDIYTPRGLHLFGAGDKELDKQAHAIIMEYRGKPDAPITIYRAIPKSASTSDIHAGDWVTILKEYAVQHGQSNLNDDYKILTREVKASEIFTSGDSWYEWGFSPKIKKHLAGQHVETHGRWANSGLPHELENINGASLDNLDVLKHYTGGQDHDQKKHSGGGGSGITEVSPEVLDKIFSLTKEWGGVSLSMVDGHLPTKGYMVAKPPEFGDILPQSDWESPIKGPKIIADFLDKNKADLATGKNYLGTWLNGGKIYLDVSENITSREEAVRLGKERNQKTIWDVVNQVEIDTGGTGEIQKRNQGSSTSRHFKDDTRGNREIRSGDLGEISKTQVIYFEAGLVPILKHLPGQHPQERHGRWAQQGYSAEDNESISRMSELGPSIDDLNNFLKDSPEPSHDDLVDFVNNKESLYKLATDGIDFGVKDRMAELQAEFPLHEYTEQEKMDVYNRVRQDMVNEYVENDDRTIAQMWSDENNQEPDIAGLRISFNEVYGVAHTGFNDKGEEVTLFSSVGMVTKPYGNSFRVTGEIYSGSKGVGEWYRDFTKNPDGTWEVEHSLLELKEEYRGMGFGKKFLAESENWYIARGFDSIKVGTAWDGARHWARAGFDWNNDLMDDNFYQLSHARTSLKSYEGGKHLPEFDALMDKMVTNYDSHSWSWDSVKPTASIPTPAHFANIGYKDKTADNNWAGKYALLDRHMRYRKYLREADSRDVENPIDRDGDGIIFDGTPREQKAPTKND